MKSFSLRIAGLLTGVALIVFFTATPTLKADEWNRETRIVANHQIEVPGAVLEANTPYWIKLMESPSDRQVVQVFNEDKNHLVTMFIAASAERMKPTDESAFTFMEIPAGHPVPVQTWFYPGHLIGLEFVYPKDQTDKFASYWRAERTEQVAQAAPVMAEPPQTEIQIAGPAPSNEQAAITEEPVVNEQAAMTQPKAETTEIERAKPTEPAAAEPVMTEPVQIAQNSDTNAARELPHTAGELQLLGLVGALSAALGAIRFRR